MASVGMRSVSVNLTITGEPLGVVRTTSMHIIGLPSSLVSIMAATASNINYFKKQCSSCQLILCNYLYSEQEENQC